MRLPLPRRPVAALLAALLVVCAGCSGPGNAQADRSPADDGSTAEENAAQTDADERSRLEQLYWARQDSARANYTEADVRFMTGMIKHHAQALVMSKMAPTHGASEQVQTLAARIINAQRDEIASMQAWLRERGQPAPQIEIDGLRLTADGKPVHGMDMVGVLTRAQIQELDAAQGRAFDRLFLKYMIQHHSGAVTMVDRLFAADEGARGTAAFELASGIHADQKTEIARMRKMLGAIPTGTSQSP